MREAVSIGSPAYYKKAISGDINLFAYFEYRSVRDRFSVEAFRMLSRTSRREVQKAALRQLCNETRDKDQYKTYEYFEKRVLFLQQIVRRINLANKLDAAQKTGLSEEGFVDGHIVVDEESDYLNPDFSQSDFNGWKRQPDKSLQYRNYVAHRADDLSRMANLVMSAWNKGLGKAAEKPEMADSFLLSVYYEKDLDGDGYHKKQCYLIDTPRRGHARMIIDALLENRFKANPAAIDRRVMALARRFKLDVSKLPSDK